ncbi:MAG: hypothetical protein KatS3mg070_3054 [Meiothermus sp.]|nr:MAG: hypothetical protein KatS3mg070_3054 [Meiothermus sp.]
MSQYNIPLGDMCRGTFAPRGGLAILVPSMWAAPARVHRTRWVFFLAGLVLLVSSQYALRDPRSQVLPVSFLAEADVCTFAAGASHTQSTPSPPHTHQPHYPLCLNSAFVIALTAFATEVRPDVQIGLLQATPTEPVYIRYSFWEHTPYRGPPLWA